ncbi:MAG: adenylate/guanylate cyclase domain-containing protein, partial [Rhodospirillaceae bacterium]|nr:adenylate/guanylate cyclase domain-containing protein [Rhodospirillaceae bacterium]
MRDDTFQPEGDGPKTSAAGRLRSWLAAPFAGWSWAKALSWSWWWKGFRKSWILSGRLTTILLLVGIVALRFDEPQWAQRLRAQTFDVFQQIKPRPFTPDGPVVIVDLDEKSLAEQGQWPWQRTTIADMVEKLTAMGAKVIGFDVVFSEADRTSIATVARSVEGLDEATLSKLTSLKTNDEVLAEAMKKSGIVVLGATFAQSADIANSEPLRTSFAVKGPDPAAVIENQEFVLRPIPILEQAAAGNAIFSVAQNRLDGIVREVPLLMKIRRFRTASDDAKLQGLLPALTLEMLRVGLGARTIEVVVNSDNGTLEVLSMRPRGTRDRTNVLTDPQGKIWVYYTPHDLYKQNYVSATDVVMDRVDPARFKDKYVLVGASAQALQDVRASPLDPVLPGVEVHANIIENILFNQQLKRLPEANGDEIVTAIIAGLVIIILTPMVSARVGAVTVLVIAGAIIGYCWNAYATRLELYDPTFPTSVVVMFYIFLTYAAFSSTEAQKKQVRAAFGQYLSPDLVETLANDPTKLKLGGENREMTFMFSDIRGFTGISELFDAQGLTKLINRLLTPMTDVILSNRGTIDKYMGDCIMAFWNAPLDVRDHAKYACRSALGMIQAVHDVNVILEAEAKAENREHRVLAVGVGINTGIACVGNMGSTQRFDYSVLGDSVNLASRLEGQSKTYHVTTVLGESTAAQASEFALLELDLIKVKGKASAVRIFTLLGDEQLAQDPDFKKLKTTHDAMMSAYRAQNWTEARKLIAQCKANPVIGKGLTGELPAFYDLYRERIEEFKAHPPGPDWDGVYV